MADRSKILTLNSISHAGLKLLPAEHYEVGGQFDRPDAILVRSHDMHAMSIPASSRRWAARAQGPTISRSMD